MVKIEYLQQGTVLIARKAGRVFAHIRQLPDGWQYTLESDGKRSMFFSTLSLLKEYLQYDCND